MDTAVLFWKIIIIQAAMKKVITPQHRDTEIHRGGPEGSPFFLCASVSPLRGFCFFNDFRSTLKS
jgi:hypothetical protein